MAEKEPRQKQDKSQTLDQTNRLHAVSKLSDGTGKQDMFPTLQQKQLFTLKQCFHKREK